MRFYSLMGLMIALCVASPAALALAVTITDINAYHTSPSTTNPSVVPQYGIFEFTLARPVTYGLPNNFFDVTITATFTGRVTGTQFTVKGFYFDTLPNGESLWKVRFAPRQADTWDYQYTYTHTPSGDQGSGTGAFICSPGEAPGFLKRTPGNNFRFQFENGVPFNPLGQNDCINIKDGMNLEGGDRFGAFQGPNRTDDYFKAYEAAGFNMFRFSTANCSLELSDDTFTTYNKDGAIFFDWLMEQLRLSNQRIFYGLFGFLLPDNPPYPPSPELYRYVDYSINRWGAYVDVWELLNERAASNAWINAVGGQIENNDPYGHLITTSWEAPELASIDISAPHWYAHENELNSDLITAQKADSWKGGDKPVVVGEQGNSAPAGQFGNWFADSALRLRIRCWTAFFKEISFLFWNTSYATNGNGGGAANIWLGPEERQYSHVLQWFANTMLRPDTDPVSLPVSNSSLMRAYGLTSNTNVAGYIHHYADHTNTVSGQTVTVAVPVAGVMHWIQPSTGQTLATAPVSIGTQVLTIPNFIVDIAFFTRSANWNTNPIANIAITNPQADGDLDNDGLVDFGPSTLPFGMPPLALTLNGGGSYDPDGGALSYLWHFGDGSPDDTSSSVVHNYPDGSFLTTLTVTDNEGKQASHALSVRATGDPNPNTNNAPQFNPFKNMTVHEGELVMITTRAVDFELQGSAYVSDTLIYSATNLPSGATFGVIGVPALKQFWWVPNFTQSGIYNVQFHVQDAGGLFAPPETVTITVLDATPSTEDSDGDGVTNSSDNCPLNSNNDQQNDDGDLFGDVCDNCADVVNNDQADYENDGQGDACDLDGDNDGILNTGDNCPFYASADLTDDDGDGRGNVCDICPGTIPGASVDAAGCPPLIPGDIDGDGDVDPIDFGTFQLCLSGSAIPQPLPMCLKADIDGDGDVDSVDFITFNKCMGGANVPMSPTCAN